MAKDGVDSAWRTLFEQYNILEEINKNGYFKITANQIKKVKEPRLMTKFDEFSQMPRVLRDHGISVISDSRKSYILGRFALFKPVSYKNQNIRSVETLCLETLKFENLYSESSSILFAFNSNILKDAFGTEDIAFTTYGRMGAGSFTFDVDLINTDRTPTGVKKRIEVNKPQIEIDGAFETEDSFFIVEAKNRFVEDINLRQVYFPYKYWSSQIDKKVVPVFLVYSDKSFYLYVCSFENPDDINSLKIEKSFKFASNGEPITMSDVVSIFENIAPSSSIHSDIFPQADRMEKIIDLLNLLDSNEHTTKEEITNYFEFDPRQTDYYLNAAAFIGMVQIVKRKGFGLSENGKGTMKKQMRDRNLDIIRAILQDEVYYQSFDYLLKNNALPDKEYIAELIRKYYPPKKNGDQTPGRRSQTVISWINWIIDLTNP